MKMKKIALVLSAALLFTVCGCSKTDGKTAAVQAVTIAAQGSSVGTVNRFGGMVVAQSEIGIQKDENRTVKEVLVEEGQEVNAGDILFTYDIDEIQIALEKLELEKEQLENTISSTAEEISRLEKEKATAPSSEHLAYSVQIQEMQISLSEAKYNLTAKEKEIIRTKATLENAEVTTPVSGVVKSIANGSEQQNGYYEPNTDFITISETGEYKVKGSISELNAGEMSEGTRVLIRSRLDETQLWYGTVETVEWGNAESNENNYYYGGPVMEDYGSSSSYPFYVVLDSADGLMLGQHVYIEPDVGQGENREGLWLSSAYICQAEGDAFVWAMGKNEKLEKRSLKLGTYDTENDLYEIISGLTITDYIAFPDESLRVGMATVKYDEEMFTEFDPIDAEYGEGSYIEEGVMAEEYGEASVELFDVGMEVG